MHICLLLEERIWKVLWVLTVFNTVGGGVALFRFLLLSVCSVDQQLI